MDGGVCDVGVALDVGAAEGAVCFVAGDGVVGRDEGLAEEIGAVEVAEGRVACHHDGEAEVVVFEEGDEGGVAAEGASFGVDG